MMSGCPGAPGDSHANWITTEWPPEVRDILRWQWDEVLIPYWRDLVAYARDQGVPHLCLELHGYQNVYNVATLKRLRDAVGDTVGANLDPSHLMWMGADPLAAARALGDAIYYVHAKDTRIDPSIAGVNGVIDTTPGSEFRIACVELHHARTAVTTRAGGAASSSTLADVGYDGVLSIEHEDPAMSAVEGVERVGGVAAASDRRPAAPRACSRLTPRRAGAASSCSMLVASCCNGIRAISIASSSPATTQRWSISSPTSAPRNGTSGRTPAARSPTRRPSFCPRMPTRRISSTRSVAASTR